MIVRLPQPEQSPQRGRTVAAHSRAPRSFSAVSRELNEAGIPAMAGGRWYPLTVRRVLMNET